MTKEKICYYCKHVQNVGTFCPSYKCALTDEKKESFDSCSDWKDYEEK